MNDAASFDAIMQCNLLEVFCEALGTAIVVTDKLDQVTFASTRLQTFFPINDKAITPGVKARDLYGALFDAGCRLGATVKNGSHGRLREDWIAERIAGSWKERADTIDQIGPERWVRVVSRRFSSGLGFLVLQDVSEQKKKEILWRAEQERVRLTEEILDTIPVAIAVKDRNLTYAAVNQEFCRLHKITPDEILGRRVWDLVVPQLAEQFEERDWRLLANGEEQNEVMQLRNAQGDNHNILFRARRVGKPGHHYISMSFTEMSAPGRELSINAPAVTHIEASDIEKRRQIRQATRDLGTGHKRALILDEKADRWAPIAQALAARDVEICVLANETELRAFLPLARDQGIAVDRVFIERSASVLAYNIAGAAGLPVTMIDGSQDAPQLLTDLLNGLFLAHLEPEPKPAATMPEFAPAGVSAAEPELAQGPEIIAVEDGELNRMVLAQLIENTGLTFAIASSGQEALSLIKKHPPRLVFADITLPDMSLVDFAHDVRKIASGVPVVGIMPGDDARHRSACLDAGLDGSFAKPISAEIIEDFARRFVLAGVGIKRATPAAGKK